MQNAPWARQPPDVLATLPRTPQQTCDFIFYAFLNSLWTLWAGEELNFKRESCRLELGAEVGCRSEADVRRVSASSGRFGQVE